MVFRSALVIASLVLAVVAGGTSAGADSYPTKPIRVIVGFAPGGTTDVLARVVAQKLAERLRSPVYVENRGGVSGSIGADVVAKSAPDGYTLFFGTPGALTVNQSLFKLAYDPLRDLAPVVLLSSQPMVVVVHPALPVKTFPELIAYAKAHPGELSYATGGAGTSNHLAGELLKSTIGIDMVHVGYKGSAPAMTDLLAGRVQLMIEQIVGALPHIRAGKLRALAVTTGKRSSVAPDLPTIAESGVPGFEVSTWHCLVAPAGTPQHIIAKIHEESTRILQLPDVRERLASQGVESVGLNPEQFGAFMRAEAAKWAKVVKDAGIRVE